MTTQHGNDLTEIVLQLDGERNWSASAAIQATEGMPVSDPAQGKLISQSRRLETGAPGNHIARKAVTPKITMKIENASRIVLPMRTRCSVAVPQFNKSRSRHGVTVNQMPAMTNR